jgi:hypothetical protein
MTAVTCSGCHTGETFIKTGQLLAHLCYLASGTCKGCKLYAYGSAAHAGAGRAAVPQQLEWFLPEREESLLIPSALLSFCTRWPVC